MLYEQYEPYAKLGERVINNERSLQWIRQTDVRIGFLRSFKEKHSSGKDVFGECIKVSELYEPFCPYDFLIVLYEPNIVGMYERQLYALMHHELLHVGILVALDFPSGETIRRETLESRVTLGIHHVAAVLADHPATLLIEVDILLFCFHNCQLLIINCQLITLLLFLP